MTTVLPPAADAGLVTVALAPESPLLARGLADGLRAFDDIAEVEVARSLDDLVASVRRLRRVVVFQPRFFANTDPVDAVRGLARCPGTHSLALMANASPRLHDDFVRAGSSGIFPLRRSTEELARAVVEVSRGATLAYDPELRGDGALRARQRGLSGREYEVLELLVEGRSNRAIGEVLFISQHTARHHVQAVLAKLGVNSRVEAAAIAIREHLVDESR
jgi:DNA-binding NarL/FixJ family response regulator